MPNIVLRWLAMPLAYPAFGQNQRIRMFRYRTWRGIAAALLALTTVAVVTACAPVSSSRISPAAGTASGGKTKLLEAAECNPDRFEIIREHRTLTISARLVKSGGVAFVFPMPRTATSTAPELMVHKLVCSASNEISFVSYGYARDAAGEVLECHEPESCSNITSGYEAYIIDMARRVIIPADGCYVETIGPGQKIIASARSVKKSCDALYASTGIPVSISIE